MPDTALVVMARYPESGKIKTRLARAIGHAETVCLYRAFLADLAQRFVDQPYDLHWAFTPAEANFSAFAARLAPSPVQRARCFQQQGEDLGARLLGVFRWTQARHFRRTIVISSDSPQVSQEIIAHAARTLDEADVVLGPAEDGGYYLIAMRRPYDVFSGVPMSTAVVLERTIELAERQGLTVRLLEPLFDVDELPDLLRLAHLLETESALAPVTAAHLALKKDLYADYLHSYTPAFDLHRANQPV